MPRIAPAMGTVYLVAASLLALAAAGCGGDDRLSGKEFTAKAEATCTRYEKKLARLPQPKSLKDFGALADEAIPIVENGVEDLRGLKPPENLESKYEKWLDANDANVEDFKKLRDAAKAGDESKVRSLVDRVSANEKKGDELARDIGIDRCGND